MKSIFLRYTFIMLVSAVIAVPLLLGATSFAQTKMQGTIAITDIASWKHPVKEVLTRHKVQLSKVNLTKNNKYPVFYVTLPYDPQSSETSEYFNQLYAEVLEANGWWSYAFHDEQDQIQIEINWDKSKKQMSIDIVPLQGPTTDKK